MRASGGVAGANWFFLPLAGRCWLKWRDVHWQLTFTSCARQGFTQVFCGQRNRSASERSDHTGVKLKMRGQRERQVQRGAGRRRSRPCTKHLNATVTRKQLMQLTKPERWIREASFSTCKEPRLDYSQCEHACRVFTSGSRRMKTTGWER